MFMSICITSDDHITKVHFVKCYATRTQISIGVVQDTLIEQSPNYSNRTFRRNRSYISPAMELYLHLIDVSIHTMKCIGIFIRPDPSTYLYTVITNKIQVHMTALKFNLVYNPNSCFDIIILFFVQL